MDSLLEGGVPSPNAYTSMNKFINTAENPERTRWTGFCMVVHNLRRYEFRLQFDTLVNYPATVPEIELLDLDGKIHKMYMGRKDLPNSTFQAPLGRELSPICNRSCFVFGSCTMVGSRGAILVDSGMVNHKDDEASSAES